MSSTPETRLRSRRRPRRGSPWLALLLAGAALAAALPRQADTRSAPPAVAPSPPAADALARPAGGGAPPQTALVRQVRRGRTAVVPAADATTILLGSGLRFDPVRDGAPPQVGADKARPLQPGETGAFVVQVRGPVQDGWREALEAEGATLFAYLPQYAFMVRAPAGREARLAALPFVRWVGAWQPGFKRSPQPEMDKTGGETTLVVLLFPDASLPQARAALTGLGGRILEATSSGRNKLLRVAIDAARVGDVVARHDVAWVEPWHELHLDNATCQWVVQTNVSNDRRIWSMGLQGQGQVIHTSDSGVRTSHNQFRDAAITISTFGDYPTHRKIIAYKPTVPGVGILFGDTSGASYHGTHTAGTCMGDDSPFAADLRDGMALQAKLYFQDGGNTSNSITSPGDLNLMFQEPYTGNAGGAARVSSNSWGSDVAGAYTVHAMTADQFMWDHKDFLISFSNGNAGTPGSVGSPASFKNGISMGATQNGTNAGLMMTLTSQGPAADGRRKPTVLSPGQAISSASGVSNTTYQSLTGTSMASPSGAGALTLARQYLTDGWYPTGAAVPAHAFVPSAALVKAMAIASTDNDMTGYNIPNHVVGWGRINLDNVLYFPGDTERTALVDQTGGISTGEFLEYEIQVTDAGVPLKIALCWVDKEGNPAAAQALVNDLDLTVVDPGSTTYLGNVFASGQSATGGSRDALNVEECVRRTTPALGTWLLRVDAANVPFGPQPFAIAVSGGVGASAGLVQLDRASYGRSDVVEVRVEDLNAASPITVQVASTTEATPEALVIAGTNGVFVATIPTTAALAAPADSQLSVAHGDAITATYVDASPAATLEAAAVVDFRGPTVSGVDADCPNTSATIVWSSDTQATSRVLYGTTPALGSASTLDPDLVTAHEVVLDGLLPATDYYYAVESSDRVGNTTVDDGGGALHRFTAGKRGDVLLVIGDESFAQVDSYRTAFAARGWEPHILSGATITDPLVGDLADGMRSYLAVWWQVGHEQYPPVPDAARDSLTAYLGGGGRLSFVSHDAAWAFGDAGSGFSSPARLAWLEGQLRVHWLADPLTWPSITGQGGDPISASYTGGLAYTPHRDGAAGDEVSAVPGTGTSNLVWRNTDTTVGDIGYRWVNGVANGTPGNGVWGGTPTRVVTNCLEWSQIDDATARADVLDKTLVWLIGHDHPDVALSAPNGGETLTGPSTSIAWSETTYSGTSVASRALYWSDDGGASWTLITAAPGPSPYSWDVSALPNGATYRVRAVVTDDGTPALAVGDVSDADFTIARPGGDTRGPRVQAGSIQANPDPMDNRVAATLVAVVSDVGQGDGNVAAAEWSTGVVAAAAGSGHPMSGAFGTPTVAVTAAVAVHAIPSGEQPVWVRGQDAAGVWGPALAHTFHVNGDAVTDSGRLPLRYALHANVPNPFNPTTLIRYELREAGPVRLDIYNVRGERVRRLVAAHQEAGRLTAAWDGRDDAGAAVTSGIYFYRLAAGPFTATRKMVLLR